MSFYHLALCLLWSGVALALVGADRRWGSSTSERPWGWPLAVAAMLTAVAWRASLWWAMLPPVGSFPSDGHFWQASFSQRPWAILVADLAAIGGVLLLLRVRGVALREVLMWRGPLRLPLVARTLLGVVLIALSYGLSLVLAIALQSRSAVSELPGDYTDLSLVPPLAWAPLWCRWWVGLIGSPVLEELVDRGLVYPLLAGRIGRVGGALLSGVLFAASHGVGGSVEEFASRALFGSLAAGAFSATGVLWVPMLMHAAWNLPML